MWPTPGALANASVHAGQTSTWGKVTKKKTKSSSSNNNNTTASASQSYNAQDVSFTHQNSNRAPRGASASGRGGRGGRGGSRGGRGASGPQGISSFLQCIQHSKLLTYICAVSRPVSVRQKTSGEDPVTNGLSTQFTKTSTQPNTTTVDESADAPVKSSGGWAGAVSGENNRKQAPSQQQQQSQQPKQQTPKPIGSKAVETAPVVVAPPTAKPSTAGPTKQSWAQLMKT